VDLDINGNTPAHLALLDGRPWDDLPGSGVENRYGLTPEAMADYLRKGEYSGRGVPYFSQKLGTLEKMSYERFLKNFGVDWADQLIFSEP